MPAWFSINFDCAAINYLNTVYIANLADEHDGEHLYDFGAASGISQTTGYTSANEDDYMQEAIPGWHTQSPDPEDLEDSYLVLCRCRSNSATSTFYTDYTVNGIDYTTLDTISFGTLVIF